MPCPAWKGPADGNGLEGEEDRDAREDNLSSVDWSQVLLETHIQEGEASITGEEKLRRAKNSDNIQLGGRSFFSLWEDYLDNREDSVLEKLRRKRKGVKTILFLGLVLRFSDGSRNVLSLRFNDSDSEWYWDNTSLGYHFHGFSHSASLASN